MAEAEERLGQDGTKMCAGIALLRDSLQMGQPVAVKVKNTFIEFEDEGVSPAVGARYSTPGVRVGRSRLLSDLATPSSNPEDLVFVSTIQEGDEDEGAAAQGPPVQSWASISSPTATGSVGVGRYWFNTGDQHPGAVPAPGGVAPTSTYIPISQPTDRPAVCDACGNVFMADSNFCRICGKPRPQGPTSPLQPAAMAPPAPAVVTGPANARVPSLPVAVAPSTRLPMPPVVAAVPAPKPGEMPLGETTVTPLPLRKSEFSEGAKLHGTGNCRPCAWFWKPQGCQHVRECHYCHMCPEGALKARKKEKVSQMRDDRT